LSAQIFDKKNVIVTQIREPDLESFLVDFDIDNNGSPRYMLDELTQVITDVIPEYVFAYYENPEILQTEIVEKVRESAKSIYKIKDYLLMKQAYLDNDQLALSELDTKNYKNRGEFGEIILHLFLRKFHETIPLISKVYFRDSNGVPAHGFDAVHITTSEQILWLGESKFYSDGKQGIKALLDDIKEHINKDYLEDQVLVIKKNLECNMIPQREEWIKLLNNTTKLKDIIKIINIPLLCTYPHDLYRLYSDLKSQDAVVYHESNVRELKSYFNNNNDHPLKQRLNVILMLFPVRDKNELVKKLHERLWHMQNI
jgi:hypothetical protein